MRIQGIIVLVVLFMSAVSAFAERRGFAIVVDPRSYREAKTEIEAYAQTVEKQGLKVYLIEDVWGVPDSIQLKLKSLQS